MQAWAAYEQNTEHKELPSSKRKGEPEWGKDLETQSMGKKKMFSYFNFQLLNSAIPSAKTYNDHGSLKYFSKPADRFPLSWSWVYEKLKPGMWQPESNTPDIYFLRVLFLVRFAHSYPSHSSGIHFWSWKKSLHELSPMDSGQGRSTPVATGRPPRTGRDYVHVTRACSDDDRSRH